MLVLTRRSGEGIMIGEEIELRILEVSGEKVRVGIDAPRDVAVFRTEVFERIEAGRDAGQEAEPIEAERRNGDRRNGDRRRGDRRNGGRRGVREAISGQDAAARR